MSEPFLGEIRAFSFNFPPRGWAFCNGQILPINQNTALFALLGTTYGGNGTTTFQLPNLQGTLPIGMGPINAVLGGTLGEEFHTLLSGEMPAHNHTLGAFSNPVTPTDIPTSSVILATATTDQTGNPGVLAYGTGTPATQVTTTGVGGSNQPHENRMPFLVTNYCIALQGIFPTRN
jgi:microcystin-dependent protein